MQSVFLYFLFLLISTSAVFRWVWFGEVHADQQFVPHWSLPREGHSWCCRWEFQHWGSYSSDIETHSFQKVAWCLWGSFVQKVGSQSCLMWILYVVLSYREDWAHGADRSLDGGDRGAWSEAASHCGWYAWIRWCHQQPGLVRIILMVIINVNNALHTSSHTLFWCRRH